MKNTVTQSLFALSKIQKQHIQIFLFLLTLIMLVLGAGAPDSGGGVSGPK